MVSDEQISALMDGELSESEVSRAMERLRKDPDLTARWQRYHMVRDVLHGSRAVNPHLDLSSRIRSALQDEPVPFSPRRKTRHFGPFLKQVAGMAIAASVATIAILSFQAVNQDQPTRLATTTPVSSERAAQQAPMQMRTDPRLDAYLVNHNEHSVSTGMHGMLPYARIVSHGTEGGASQ